MLAGVDAEMAVSDLAAKTDALAWAAAAADPLSSKTAYWAETSWTARQHYQQTACAHLNRRRTSGLRNPETSVGQWSPRIFWARHPSNNCYAQMADKARQTLAGWQLWGSAVAVGAATGFAVMVATLQLHWLQPLLQETTNDLTAQNCEDYVAPCVLVG